MVHQSTEKSEAKLMRRRPRGRPPSSPRHSLATDDDASWSEGRAARRCAEADFGRTYRESNRGCRRRYVAHRHRHVARCRRRARGCSRYVTAARHRAGRGQHCAYWQQQCLAKLVRLPQAGPVAVGVTKIFVFRFFFFAPSYVLLVPFG